MEEIETWMNKAEEDLETAKFNLKGGKLGAAAFYSQQAVEKALKSLQIKKFNRFDRTHDLIFLAKSVDASKEIILICEKISPFYTITRYPDVFVRYTKKDISSRVEMAEKVVEWVKRKLKS